MDEKLEKQWRQWYEEIPSEDESEHDPYSTDDSIADPEYTQPKTSPEWTLLVHSAGPKPRKRGRVGSHTFVKQHTHKTHRETQHNT
nr:unnamed protein product [Callosobruchus chinensis]